MSAHHDKAKQDRLKFWLANLDSAMAMLRKAGDITTQVLILFDERDATAWKLYTDIAAEAAFDLAKVPAIDKTTHIPTGLVVVPAEAAERLFAENAFVYLLRGKTDSNVARIVVLSGGGAMFLLTQVPPQTTTVGIS